MCFLSSRAPCLGGLTSVYVVNGNIGKNLKRIPFPWSGFQSCPEKLGQRVVKVAFADSFALTALFARSFLE